MRLIGSIAFAAGLSLAGMAHANVVDSQPGGFEVTESVEIAGRQVAVETAYAYLAALASVTGLPALSVPSGLDRQGLPAGAQLIGPGGTESVLCLLGTVIERSPGGRAVAMARDRLAARQAAG